MLHHISMGKAMQLFAWGVYYLVTGQSPNNEVLPVEGGYSSMDLGQSVRCDLIDAYTSRMVRRSP